MSAKLWGLTLLAGLVFWTHSAHGQPCHSQSLVLDCFESHGTGLLPIHEQKLESLVHRLIERYVRGNPVHYIGIRGHGATWKSTNSTAVNARRRAESVEWRLITLLNEYGIDDEQLMINVTGASDSEPVANNKTQQGRALNRRVEILLTPPTGLNFKRGPRNVSERAKSFKICRSDEIPFPGTAWFLNKNLGSIRHQNTPYKKKRHASKLQGASAVLLNQFLAAWSCKTFKRNLLQNAGRSTPPFAPTRKVTKLTKAALKDFRALHGLTAEATIDIGFMAASDRAIGDWGALAAGAEVGLLLPQPQIMFEIVTVKAVKALNLENRLLLDRLLELHIEHVRTSSKAKAFQSIWMDNAIKVRKQRVVPHLKRSINALYALENFWPGVDRINEGFKIADNKSLCVVGKTLDPDKDDRTLAFECFVERLFAHMAPLVWRTYKRQLAGLENTYTSHERIRVGYLNSTTIKDKKLIRKGTTIDRFHAKKTYENPSWFGPKLNNAVSQLAAAFRIHQNNIFVPFGGFSSWLEKSRDIHKAMINAEKHINSSFTGAADPHSCRVTLSDEVDTACVLKRTLLFWARVSKRSQLAAMYLVQDVKKEPSYTQRMKQVVKEINDINRKQNLHLGLRSFPIIEVKQATKSSGSRWVNARLLARDGSQFYVHFENQRFARDQWLDAKLTRPRTLKIGDHIPLLWKDGRRYWVRVTGFEGDKQIHVHWLGYRANSLEQRKKIAW